MSRSGAASAAAANGADDESASTAPYASRGCRWHKKSPDGWRVLCAIGSQMQPEGDAHCFCLPKAPQAAVPALIDGFFLHLRVVQSAATGKRRVLFTDIAKSFGMGNNAWQVHLANRFPGARKIRVTDSATNGRNEYISLSLGDFGQFVRWANGECTGVNAARDKSIRTTFQQKGPQPNAARAFLQQARDLLAAFGQLHPAPAPSAPQPPPSLVSFLLGHRYIREATFAAGGLREVNADGLVGAPLALTAFQRELQSKAPAKKEQRRIDKENKMQLNKQRKAQGLPNHRIRKPQMKKTGPCKQRERAAAEADQPPLQIQLPFYLPVAALPDRAALDGEESEDERDGEDNDGEESEAEEGEEDEDDNRSRPRIRPLSPASQFVQLVQDTRPFLGSDLPNSPSPTCTDTDELVEYPSPNSPSPDLELDGEAMDMLDE